MPSTSPATSLADRTIAALRANHDRLAALVPDLSDEQLAGTSGASEWSVAQVLSHLGSGAEIGLAGYRAALEAAPAPAQDFNQGVWDRWNAMSARDQADRFLEHNTALVAFLEGLSPEQRETAQVELGFVPFPLSIASLAGMRLNESAQHGWDVRVALDPDAGLADDEASLVAEHLADGLSFMLGFTGKPDALAEPAVVQVEGSGVGIVVGDEVSLTTAVQDATATFAGPLETAIRLLGGRLGPEHTPEGVAVTGNVTLDDLRRVFPGY